MSTTETDRSNPRIETGSFIIAKGNDGYRVRSPLMPTQQYIVTGVPQDPQCTCADFLHPERPPEWQCPHILAVLDHLNNPQPSPEPSPEPHNGGSIPEPPPANEKKQSNGHGKGAAMLLKRSISPNGRIDSLSLEFSCPLGSMTDAEIQEQVGRMLVIQSTIVDRFLGAKPARAKNNGNGHVPPEAVSARIIGVSSIKGRYGPKRVLNVQVNDKVLNLFGSAEDLAEAMRTAGFNGEPNRLTDGMKFDLPCRVVTKPNGNYVNIERVYPADVRG